MVMNRSQIMAQIRSVSRIERVPEFLKGQRMRHQPKGVYGRPDFANKSRKVCLFIDGCFWHGHDRDFKLPKTNLAFWKNKIDRNKERDKEVTETLIAEGWTVYRIWECELKEMK